MPITNDVNDANNSSDDIMMRYAIAQERKAFVNTVREADNKLRKTEALARRTREKQKNPHKTRRETKEAKTLGEGCLEMFSAFKSFGQTLSNAEQLTGKTLDLLPNAKTALESIVETSASLGGLSDMTKSAIHSGKQFLKQSSNHLISDIFFMVANWTMGKVAPINVVLHVLQLINNHVYNLFDNIDEFFTTWLYPTFNSYCDWVRGIKDR